MIGKGGENKTLHQIVCVLISLKKKFNVDFGEVRGARISTCLLVDVIFEDNYLLNKSTGLHIVLRLPKSEVTRDLQTRACHFTFPKVNF